MKQPLSLFMKSFVAGESNLPVLNLDTCTSDYFDYTSPNFFIKTCTDLNFQNLVGVRQSTLEDTLKQEILTFLQIKSRLTPDNIIFGFGSYSILERLASKVLPRGTMIGEFPQFPYFPLEYTLVGGTYLGVSFDDAGLPANKILETIADTQDIKVIYINNPNNPTGQTWSRLKILEILEEAMRKNIFVIIDEVYADLLPVTESFAGLVNDYENLVIVRSFSKIFGLQNLRVGYMIAHPSFIQKYQTLCNWNEVTNIGALSATALLKDAAYRNDLEKTCAENKKTLIKICGEAGYTVSPTHPLVPLLWLRAPENQNAQEYFRLRNMKVGNNVPYTMLVENFPQNYCRIRVPNDFQIIEEIQTRLCE